jgi:hypothetical protein
MAAAAAPVWGGGPKPAGHHTAAERWLTLLFCCSNSPEVNTGDVAAGQERDVITVLQVTNEGASPLYPANLAGRTAGACVPRGVGERGVRSQRSCAMLARLEAAQHQAACAVLPRCSAVLAGAWLTRGPSACCPCPTTPSAHATRS